MAKQKTIEKQFDEVCLNKFLGNCPDCTTDFSDHHPNNRDCQGYHPVRIYQINENRNIYKH